MQRALRSLILLVAAAVATAVPLRGTFTLAADAALADDDALNAVVAAASVVTPPVHDLTPGELLIVRDQRLTRKNGPQFWHGDMQDCCVNEHGWQTACGQSEGCTLQSTAQLADKGALSEALPSASETFSGSMNSGQPDGHQQVWHDMVSQMKVTPHAGQWT